MLSVDYYLNKAEELKCPVHGVVNSTDRVNIVGWRNLGARNNYFDCWISLYWRKGGRWHEEHFAATTYPGIPSLLNPVHKDGTAILVPGFYDGLYKIGRHRGRYEALVQQTPCKVYRDNNKDGKVDVDADKVYEGVFGINLHKAGTWNKIVGASSAGCQVIKNTMNFEYLMYLCRRDTTLYSNSFNYTLMEF